MTKVHSREGKFLHYDLHLFILYEQHVVLRRVIYYYTLYYDVLEEKCSIDIGYPIGGLWGKPHDSWCAPLTAHFIFIILSYNMIVATKKWLERHVLLFVLR